MSPSPIVELWNLIPSNRVPQHDKIGTHIGLHIMSLASDLFDRTFEGRIDC